MSSQQPRQARELPAGGVHERRDELDRFADTLAVVAGAFRRAFVRSAG